MPHSLSDQILDYLFEDVFYRFRHFFSTEPDFKYAISLHFQPRKFEPGEIIYEEGDTVHELYFVMEG
jgi:CRP-like cAMP-binding protein